MGPEARVEVLARHLLGDTAEPALVAQMKAIRPPTGALRMAADAGADVARPAGAGDGRYGRVASLPTDGTPEESGDGTARKTRRMKTDQAAREAMGHHPYKFEAMLTWAEMMNINRRV